MLQIGEYLDTKNVALVSVSNQPPKKMPENSSVTYVRKYYLKFSQ